MNRLEKILSKFNFKKIAVWYLISAVIAGLICVGTVGYIYREQLGFAWQYSRLQKAKTTASVKAAADKTAKYGDVVDVLILDKENNVTYSAKKSEFKAGVLQLTKAGSEKKYLVSAKHPDAVFRYVKSDEFMLNSIVNKDFGKIRDDYDDERDFETDLSSKTVYVLSRIGLRDGGKVYVITVPSSVAGGKAALKVTAALAVMFFGVYWALIALWMYKDAAKRKLSPFYWGLIGLFTNIVGLLVYKIYKRSMTFCTSCGAAQSHDNWYCSVCGAELGTRCENCGSRIAPKDVFCHSCGSKINKE